ncbi:MAG: hypothetical protein IKM61_08370 [Eubacteriaceae bacterium]|nr:hypothetical protein [Eubacteriaceae bacterium]
MLNNIFGNDCDNSLLILIFLIFILGGCGGNDCNSGCGGGCGGGFGGGDCGGILIIILLFLLLGGDC